MTQEEKELVIKDLCARLPYSVQIHISYEDGFKYDKTLTYEDVKNYSQLPACSTTIVKPYLRPLSSMTDEEEAEIANIIEGIYDFTFRTEELLEMISMQKTFPMASIDWFHEKGFDIRGLIPKGLALEAPEGIYNNQNEKNMDYKMDYKKAYEASLDRAKELWGIYKDERHIIEFILPEVCYLKDKEERLKDMASEKRKEFTCPKCGVVLNDNTYDEHTVYHN